MSKSPECIAPSAFDVIERQQSAKVGIFNLISTMIGGGVLSLPFAMSRSGLLLGFIMLTISAITSVFSFDILVSSSRRTGAMTYQMIGFFAFGKRIQSIITFLIFCLTITCGIAYCVLVGDLIKPIICYLGTMSPTQCSAEWLRRLVIAGGIFCVAPFCYMRQIKALQYTSFISITSVIILAAIIASKTATNFDVPHDIYYINQNGLKQTYTMTEDIRLFPDSIEDVIYVFPVFFVSFLCHFNIPQVHAELTRPTRKRMRMILVTVVSVCYILYATVAFFGYFYSFQYTCGNILLNYNQNDPIVTIARLCLGFVILFTFPLLILPARSSMHNLLNLIYTFNGMNVEDNENGSFYEDSRSEISSKHAIDSDSESGSETQISDTSEFGLFGSENMKNKTVGGENVAVNNIKPIKKLQVVNRNLASYALTPPLVSMGSPHSTYSRSTNHLLSQQRRNVTYNTFNVNTTQKLNTDKKAIATQSSSALRHFLKSKDVKIINYEHDDNGSERSYRSHHSSFTTRSFSVLDSPLREPSDALGIINSPQDIESLRGKDFTKHFKDLQSAKFYKPTTIWLIGETTIMIGLALFVAFLTESVMVVWSFMGSTVSFMIAFSLPGLFYFKIRFKRKGWTYRNISAIIILCASGVAIIFCTWQAMSRLNAQPCPNQPLI